jgi:hypothetical protein
VQAILDGLKGLETLDLLRAASGATLLERAGQTVVGVTSTAAEAFAGAPGATRPTPRARSAPTRETAGSAA